MTDPAKTAAERACGPYFDHHYTRNVATAGAREALAPVREWFETPPAAGVHADAELNPEGTTP